MTKKQEYQRFMYVNNTMQYMDKIQPKDEQQGT